MEVEHHSRFRSCACQVADCADVEQARILYERGARDYRSVAVMLMHSPFRFACRILAASILQHVLIGKLIDGLNLQVAICARADVYTLLQTRKARDSLRLTREFLDALQRIVMSSCSVAVEVAFGQCVSICDLPDVSKYVLRMKTIKVNTQQCGQVSTAVTIKCLLCISNTELPANKALYLFHEQEG